MSAFVYCRTTARGRQSFFVEAHGETHYLFSQAFRASVKAYYENGVWLDFALDFSRAGRNTAVLNTMRKLPGYIKYVEKLYDISLLRQTARKKRARSA